MPVYLVMLAAVIGAGIPLCKKHGKTGKIIYCIAAALVFTFVSAVRFKVGYDYNLYGGLYFNMKYLEIADISALRQEKGFLLPFYILNLANEEYFYAFIFTSIVFYPVIFLLIYKNSKHPWLSTAAFLCLGIFFNSLCFLRQFLAAIIILYAMKFAEGNNPLRFLAFAVIASAFHWSALIWLPVYFLVKIKPGWIHLGVAAAATALFCVFSRDIMLWITRNFEMYSGYDPDTNIEASQGLAPWYSIMFGIVFLVSFFFRKRLAQKNSANSIYLNCLMYTVIFEVLGTRHAILSRLAILTYLAPVLYMLPDLMDVIHEYIREKNENAGKQKTICKLSAVSACVFSVLCYVLLILDNYNGVNPYISQFHKTEEIFVEYTDPVTQVADEQADTNEDAPVTTSAVTQPYTADDSVSELEEDILDALEQLS